MVEWLLVDGTVDWVGLEYWERAIVLGAILSTRRLEVGTRLVLPSKALWLNCLKGWLASEADSLIGFARSFKPIPG